MDFATSAGLEGRGHTKDTITNKRYKLASSDTLARQQRTIWLRQLPGQTLSTGNGESRTMAYVKSLIRP